MRFLVIGDSNLRDAGRYLLEDQYLQEYGLLSDDFFFFSNLIFLYNFCYSALYDGVGGRRCVHLSELVDFAKEYTHVFVIVGDNDVRDHPVEFLCNEYQKFINDVWPTNVKFAGNLPRRDLDPVVVTKNNIFLSEKLGRHYKSSKIIKREDFHYREAHHFDRSGHGYRHMAALILSVFEEFVLKW